MTNPQNRKDREIASYLVRKTGIPSPQAAMVELARRTLYESFDGEDPDVPIDLSRVSNTLGVPRVVERSGIGADAALIPDGRTLSIELRVGNRTSLGRRRFSWAHELCHTYFYEFKDGHWSRAVSAGSELEEDLCDIGAHEILMPETPLLNTLEGLTGSKSVTDATVAFAREVQVSPSALLRRMRQLGLWENVAFACYMKVMRKGQMTLKPTWRSPAANPHVQFEEVEVLPPSILHRAFATRGLTREYVVSDWITPRKRTLVEARRYSDLMLLVATIRKS
ncbi:MAG: ImmA/IrrE family metallo-endopeptidase [Thermoplasmata archaeon]|nr:ImmA/IrrE family metallo-endopeptidase [Thermoplasmata archaeon]